MDEFQIPSDLGRIPGKIHCGEGFSNFTADQWRIFFTIYAYGIAMESLFELDAVRESHERLIEIVKLIEKHYGQDKITPNLHLSLHLSECTYDFGPLYAFWCFSFERMNGVLGALPNSHRKIEPEIMRRMMADIHIDSIINSGENVKGLELLNNRAFVGSLAEADEFSADEMERFWLNSRNIQQSIVTGSESFPGEMLGPASENIVISNSMLDLLIEYYLATYETLEFRKPFREGHENSRIISVKMKQFGRCRIDSETLGIEDDEICNVELWGTKFYPEGQDCIIPVHNILSRFVPIKYKISDRKNAREYLAVNPINRKFNIR
ncbi:hypothetical protein GLOIN_2v1786147 [Rhizophagus irregularis DAOM 181602=DAOM 197198]|nr:hypothetical protein GLOIN_2v1786147 [Rhizophagus irregularis DAOM 181602=DAOM 197198]